MHGISIQIYNMKTLFYNTGETEWAYLQHEDWGNISVEFIAEALTPLTINRSASFNAVSVGPSDDVSAAVLEGLYQNGIRYIAIRAPNNTSADLTVAARLGIVIANTPFAAPVLNSGTAPDLFRYMASVTWYNLDCFKKDLLSGNELVSTGYLGQSSIYFR